MYNKYKRDEIIKLKYYTLMKYFPWCAKYNLKYNEFLLHLHATLKLFNP